MHFLTLGALLFAASSSAAPTIQAEQSQQAGMIQLNFKSLLDSQDTATELDSEIGNDLTAKAVECKPVIVIFARGTWEPPPAPGLLVGHTFTEDLKQAMPGQVAVEAVKYNAGIIGYLSGGDLAGAKTMANMVTSAARQCPNSKIVMGGYSQGGQVVHRAANQLGSGTSSRVKAVVIFGDPDKGRRMKNISPSIVDTVCASSDPICYGIPLPIGAHLLYGKDGRRAAGKVKEILGSGGGGGKGLASKLPKLGGKKGGKGKKEKSSDD